MLNIDLNCHIWYNERIRNNKYILFLIKSTVTCNQFWGGIHGQGQPFFKKQQAYYSNNADDYNQHCHIVFLR